MIFYIQLVCSFVVGGLFIALQTLLAERVPVRWRGPILTIPSTLGLSLFFIGLSKSPSDAVEAAKVLPMSLGGEFLFFVVGFVFAIGIGFGLWASLFFAFVLLALFGYYAVLYAPDTFTVSIILGLLMIVVAYFSIYKKSKKSEIEKLKKFPMNLKHLLIRSLIGGTVSTLILFLAKTMGNVWGGIFAAFPATFVSTFIIYYYLQGRAVLPAVAKSLFFPGSLGLMLYAVVVSLTFPSLGIWLGTLIAYLVVFGFFGLWNFFQSCGKRPR